MSKQDSNNPILDLLNKANFSEELEQIDKVLQCSDKIEFLNSNGLLNKKTFSDKETKKDTFSSVLLYQNKLIDFNWEILLESCSSEISSINQLKIVVNFKYLNSTSLEIKEVSLILSEEEFNNFYDEISKLVKYFKKA